MDQPAARGWELPGSLLPGCLWWRYAISPYRVRPCPRGLRRA